MKDSWCKPVKAKSGSVVSGGAARNVRIAASGGMDKIVETVATYAAQDALERAEEAIRNESRRPRLKLVANSR